MNRFVTRWIILTIAAAVMVALLPGMEAKGEPPILGIAAFALCLALLDASLKPIVKFITFPLTVITLGLFALVINWLFMRLASWLSVNLFDVGVIVHGFWWSVLGSLIMTIVSALVSKVF